MVSTVVLCLLCQQDSDAESDYEIVVMEIMKGCAHLKRSLSSFVTSTLNNPVPIPSLVGIVNTPLNVAKVLRDAAEVIIERQVIHNRVC